MNNNTEKSKKGKILIALVMVAGVVVTSIITTTTGAMIQGLRADTAILSLENEKAEEQIHEKTSLTMVSTKINELGFVKANALFLSKAVPSLASR